MRSFFIAVTRNPISLLGSAVTTASAVLIVTLFAVELFGFLGNPYIGIIAYLILPAVFVLGLVLIPVGVMRERRRMRHLAQAGEAPPAFPIIDLNTTRTRNLVLTFIFFSALNIVILAAATHKGVEVMDSTAFCGQACHSVMHPEFTAYERSPHSRVKCVACHIGPGADWFVKSKLSGAWQVISTALELYPRPIPTPVHDLRPARETCEQCHWPTKFVGDRLRITTTFANDEANTPLKTALVLRVGGRQGGRSRGIHWHVDPGIRIRYRSDASRETIYDVELTREDGTVELFRQPPSDGGAAEVDAAAGDGGKWRVMDCVDCHNRPTHIYRMPEKEIDLAIEDRRISRDLPFVRREGVRLLRAEYPSHEAARQNIAAGLREFYRAEDRANVDGAALEAAAGELGRLYTLNVFPSMKVTWGTYPDHIGHEDSAGCFRCHNDEHATDDGRTISQDCATCHTLLAIEEEDPEILATFAP